MKRIITGVAALFMMAALTVDAQYYYISNLTPSGSNPGGLNSDGEYPPGGGLPAGWTTIHTGNASTPTWSSTVNLPFSFSFNGGAVSSYKVSSSGVLTFAVGTSAVPGHTNATIPSASIPDSSICVWGIQGTGTTDVIIHKTFGTTPNRQHWIQFNSYSHPNLQQGWTYWSIVLEETTNKIYLVDQKKSCVQGTTNCTGNIAITLGIQVNSTTAYQVTGSPNIQSLCSNDGTPANNVYYEFFPGTQPNFNMIASKINMQTYYALGAAPFSIAGTTRNYGLDTVKSMDVNYSVNGGAVQTSTLSSLALATGDKITYTHPLTWNPSSLGTYTIKLWTSNLNGNNDQIPSNDTATKTVYVTQDTVQRMVLCEEFTSSTCGPCASANPGYNALLNTNGVNSVGGKVASIKYQMNWPSPGNDPMYSATDGNTRKNFYSVTGIPRGVVGGNVFNASPTTLTQTIIDNEYNKPAFFDISLTPIYNGNKVTIQGSVKSLRALSAPNLALHLVIVDDYVTHTVQTNGETEFYQVFRKMVPTSSGYSMGSQTAGQTTPLYFNYTFSGSEPYLTLTSGDHSVVAFLQDMSTKEVHQAFWAPITYDVTASKEKIYDFDGVSVFPNPFADNTNVVVNLKQSETVTITMYNLVGELVLSKQVAMQKGMNNFEINSDGLSSGIYVINVNTNNSSVSKKVTINK